VAEGDFDGDRKRDVALLLAARDKPQTLLVVALRRGIGWVLELVDESEVPIASQFVVRVEPGRYESEYWGQAPPRPNEKKVITSSTDGVATGMLESTELLYFRLKGKWRFVWTSD
jgi:hypothetical protein